MATTLRAYADRARWAEGAVTLYFAAVVCFVIAGFTIALDHAAADRVSWSPIGVTSLGMCLIVGGSAAMLVECRLASAQIHAEIQSLAMR